MFHRYLNVQQLTIQCLLVKRAPPSFCRGRNDIQSHPIYGFHNDLRGVTLFGELEFNLRKASSAERSRHFESLCDRGLASDVFPVRVAIASIRCQAHTNSTFLCFMTNFFSLRCIWILLEPGHRPKPRMAGAVEDRTTTGRVSGSSMTNLVLRIKLLKVSRYA